MAASSLKIACKTFFFNNCDKLSRPKIIAKFCEFGVSRATSNRYFNSLSEDSENFLKNQQGRPKFKITSLIRRKVLALTENRIFPGPKVPWTQRYTLKNVSKKDWCHLSKNMEKNE